METKQLTSKGGTPPVSNAKAIAFVEAMEARKQAKQEQVWRDTATGKYDEIMGKLREMNSLTAENV